MSEYHHGDLHNEVTKMSVEEFLREEGYPRLGRSLGAVIEEYVSDHMEVLSDSIVPALCTVGCEVEPDGTCEHGNPAITVALGVI